MKTFSYKDKQVYLLDNSISFSLSLVYNVVLNDFFDQTYFVFFASQETFLGALSLIRGFGSIFIRFVHGPINNVSYNLYSKLYLESQKRDSEKESRELVEKMEAFLKMVITVYSSLSYFLFCYGFHSAEVFLSLVCGSQWVDATFIRGFLVFIFIILAMGVATNTEAFAKSIFNQAALQRFNKLNSGWLLIYFVVLKGLQTQGLLGVFCAYLIFYWMRACMAAWIAASVTPSISLPKIALSLLPTPLEAVLYLIGFGVSGWLMHNFSSNKLLNFGAVVAFSLLHFGVFLFFKRKFLREFRALLGK